MKRVVVDTGPLVALLNRNDAMHAWAVDQARTEAPPFYTCEAVLAEAYHLLSGVFSGAPQLTALLESGRLDWSFRADDHFERIAKLMAKYADVPMSFADACLVAMSEESESRVMTLDSDFRVYRRYRNRAIELVSPW